MVVSVSFLLLFAGGGEAEIAISCCLFLGVLFFLVVVAHVALALSPAVTTQGRHSRRRGRKLNERLGFSVGAGGRTLYPATCRLRLVLGKKFKLSFFWRCGLAVWPESMHSRRSLGLPSAHHPV